MVPIGRALREPEATDAKGVSEQRPGSRSAPWYLRTKAKQATLKGLPKFGAINPTHIARQIRDHIF